MILLDCSQYMRNGDYIPTRLEAQQDAANMLVGALTQNVESTVGVSAGTELLVSPTTEVGKILSAVHRVNMAGIDTILATTLLSWSQVVKLPLVLSVMTLLLAAPVCAHGLLSLLPLFR